MDFDRTLSDPAEEADLGDGVKVLPLPKSPQQGFFDMIFPAAFTRNFTLILQENVWRDLNFYE